MRNKRIIHKLLLASVVLTSLCSGLRGAAQSRDITPIYEAKMRFWKPTQINAQPLPEILRADDISIEGEYGYSGTFTSIQWKVQKVGKGKYTVVFQFGNCTTMFSFRRTARYENGVLILNKPVMDSSAGNSPPYNRLYSVRFQGKDYLLLDRDAARLGKNDPSAKPVGFSRLIDKKTP